MLAPATRIGAYEIVSVLGAGGMGEVYRARDTKLGRDVALKLLPPSFANDAARLARFEREARTLATLNHPHIAQIYGMEGGTPASAEASADESVPPVHALVMELVDGEDLAQRIARSPIAIDEAIAIAKQIADALEAAHEVGIVHRDLKPANIKIRRDGTVKLLDFGIAKALTAASSDSATMFDTGATEAGQRIGTAPYMSPEQARGVAVDARTDVWAFGCVMYEMLTGSRAFSGETVTDVVAAIVEREPDWRKLPAHTPPAVRRLLHRCLAKQRRERLAHLADARLELEDARAIAADDRSAMAPPHALWRIALAAVLGGVAAASILVLVGRPTPASMPTGAATHAAILLPPGEILATVSRAIEIAPDGARIAYSTDTGVYVRALDGFESRRLLAFEPIAPALNGAFSPDGRHLAVLFLNEMRIVDVATGSFTTVPFPSGVELGGILPSMSWDASGFVATFGTAGVWRRKAAASEWQQLVRLAPGEATSHAQMLPGDQHVLFTVLRFTPEQPIAATGEVVVQTFSSGARLTVDQNGSDPRYVPSGHILYVQNGVLVAVPFDIQTLRASGTAVPIIEGVRAANIANGMMHYAVSNNGVLIYVPGQALPPAAAMDLVRTNRRGGVAYLHLPPAAYETPRVSPDGRRLAVGTDDGHEASIWLKDLTSDAEIRRLTLTARNRFPVWSADGKRLAFQSDREKDLAVYSQAADGSDQPMRLTRPDAGTAHIPETWSSTHLLFSARRDQTYTLWAMSMADGRVTQFGASTSTPVVSSTHLAAAFSPDGRWVAYNRESGPPRGVRTVMVQPFPPTGAMYELVRNADGHHAVWSRDRSEIVFVPGPRRLAAVKVTTSPSFTFSPPVVFPGAGLMGAATIPRHYDILPDGEHFIGRQVAEDTATRAGAAPRLHVISNWLDALQRPRH